PEGGVHRGKAGKKQGRGDPCKQQPQENGGWQKKKGFHCPACRARICCNWRTASTIKSKSTMSACWYCTPNTNPPNCSNTPMPKPAAITPGRLPTPAVVTNTNRRIE